MIIMKNVQCWLLKSCGFSYEYKWGLYIDLIGSYEVMTGWTFSPLQSSQGSLDKQKSLVPGWRYRRLIYHLHSNEVVTSGEKIKKPYVRSLQSVSNLSLVWVLTCRLMYSSQTKTNTANSHKTSQQPNTKTQFLKCSTVQHFGLIMTRYPLDVEQEASFVLSLVRLCKCLEMKIRFLVRSIMMTRQFLLYKWK